MSLELPDSLVRLISDKRVEIIVGYHPGAMAHEWNTTHKNYDLAQNRVQEIRKKVKEYLSDKFGTFRVAWGDAVRLKRGDKTWPVSGGSFNNGVNTLRAAGGHFSNETGITTINRGQSCTMVVILSDPIRSFSILPWGQSDDPESIHFADQAESLFSKSTFKSTYFDK